MKDDPALARALARAVQSDDRARARAAAFDWNCLQHISRRFSEAEVENAAAQFLSC